MIEIMHSVMEMDSCTLPSFNTTTAAAASGVVEGVRIGIEGQLDIAHPARRELKRTMGFFIPAERENKLREYKYSGHDGSLLSRYILTPYWNNLVKIFPM